MSIFSIKKVFLLVGLWYVVSNSPCHAEVPCFFIEGATGVGKTTFLQLLANNVPDVVFVPEPVEKFVDVNGAGNILPLFFGDPQRWTFTTEVYIGLMHALAADNRAQETKTAALIVDRSMFADCYVYGRMAYQLGTMNALEWEIYQQLISWIGRATSARATGFIYLKTPPHVALKRVRARARTGEEEVSLAYQENLARLYDAWLIDKIDIPQELAQIPVLCIDATQNFKDDPEVQKRLIDQVKTFMAQHDRAINQKNTALPKITNQKEDMEITMKTEITSPFYFTRHGETDWNKNNIAMGQADISLNVTGLAQAAELAQQLQHVPIEIIVSSPLARAHETAKIVAAVLNKPIITVDELKEASWGVREGTPKDNDVDWLFEWRNGAHLADDAETYKDFIARVKIGMEKALAHQGPVLVVAHGAVFWAVQDLFGIEKTRATHATPLLFTKVDADEHVWQFHDVTAAQL